MWGGCLIACDLETLNTRWPRPALGFSATKKKWGVQITKPFIMNFWQTVISCLLYFPEHAVLECPQESKYLPIYLTRDNLSACSLLRF